MKPLEEIKKRLTAARAILPQLSEKFSKLSISDRQFLGELPKSVKTLADVQLVEKFAKRLESCPTNALQSAPPSLGAKALAAATSPTTAPIASRGLVKAIAVHEATQTPDFSCLSGIERATAVHEFKTKGKLSARLQKLYDYRRNEKSK